MTEAERKMDIQLEDVLNKEIVRLRRVEKAAIDVVKAINGTSDYVVWDKAFDALESLLKEKR
jgi:hypothetical protein